MNDYYAHMSVNGKRFGALSTDLSYDDGLHIIFFNLGIFFHPVEASGALPLFFDIELANRETNHIIKKYSDCYLLKYGMLVVCGEQTVIEKDIQIYFDKEIKYDQR